MPLNEKGKKIMRSMRKQYGKNEERQFFTRLRTKAR